MELAEKYIYKVYTEKSFSAAAKALFISQPALSTAIARQEQELGFRIFDRSTIPVSLTPKGRIYIEYLEETMECESNLRHRLSQFSDMTYGTLSVGGSSSAAYSLLPIICGEFYRRYPEIRVRLDMGASGSQNNLYDKLKQQTLDLLFTYVYDPREHQAIPLLEERLVIAMHKDLAGTSDLRKYAVSREEFLSRSYSPEKEMEDLSLFQNIPFFRLWKGSFINRKMEELLGEASAPIYSIEHVQHLEMHYNMMCAGMGAVLVTDAIVAASPFGKNNVLYFVPKQKNANRVLSILSKAGTELTPIAKNFISVATEICASPNVLSKLL